MLLTGTAAIAGNGLTPYPVIAAPTPTPPARETALRVSDQLDIRRIGHVSEDEKSVLRAEWHSAASRIDEQQSLQSLTEGLRRIEVTVAEVNRTVRALPTAGINPEGEPDTQVATTSLSGRWQWPLAGGASLGLLALWLRRRRLASSTRPTSRPASRPSTPPNIAISPVQPVPSVTPAEPAHPTAASPTHKLPGPDVAASSRSVAEKMHFEASAGGRGGNDETLELAEIMLSLGLAQGAAQTLLEHISNNPRAALFHWLKLLDIYRTSGHRSDFKQAAEQLRQHFNIQAADWADTSNDTLPTLEEYPRVTTRLQELWQTPEECIDYLVDLLNDNRGGTRTGFPQPVAEEILLLVKVLKDISGEPDSPTTDKR
jgi:hypothetical protein